MKALQLAKGYVELHDDYVLLQLKEGVHFCQECNNYLISITDEHFGKDTPFTLIIVHDKHFSIDPFVFGRQLVNKNLCAVSVVEKLPLSLQSENMFNRFFKAGKIKSVKTLDQAIKWCDGQLLNYLWSHNDILLPSKKF